MNKKLISSFLAVSFMLAFCMPAFSAPYKGRIEQSDGYKHQDNEKLFTKESRKIEQKQTVELTVSQVLNGASAIEGDEFFAEVSENVLSGSGVLLPKGTIAHGIIRDIHPPERMGRNGYIELSFDYLVTPDGREIPIEGGMTSKLNPAQQTGKILGETAASAAAGSAAGVLTAVNIAGIEGAIASHGYTVLGGAALGCVIAVGMSLFRKGSDVLIAPGDEIKVHITSSEPVQIMTHEAVREEELAYDGLDVQINDIFLEEDPFGELNTITLDLIIKNNSKTDFSSFDIELASDLRSSYHPSIFTCYKNSIASKKIKRGENISGTLSFAVDNPNRKHWLVFYDRRFHKPLAKISIENAKKDLNITDLKKKGKKKKKIKDA